ncbi:MAG: hypothetical protein AAFV97_03635 [Bacteroidota bacterium]
MTTQRPQVNIKLAPSTFSMLGNMAQKKHQSRAGVAKDLIAEALEYREDVAISALALSRSAGCKAVIGHQDAWR